MTKKTKEQLALELWREWFAEDGGPMYAAEGSGDLTCFFCGEWFFGEHDKHAPDCIFIRAKQLIEKE